MRAASSPARLLEGLVFMHDRQAKYYFSIHPQDYSVTDPPVYTGSGKSTNSSLESSSLSACMLRVACLNSTALLSNGTAEIREPQLEKISYLFNPVGESADKDEFAFRRGRFVVRVKRKWVRTDYYILTVAAKSRDELTAELTRLGKALDVSFEENPPQDLGPKVSPGWEWYAGYPH